jgi:hypothetical protein
VWFDENITKVVRDGKNDGSVGSILSTWDGGSEGILVIFGGMPKAQYDRKGIIVLTSKYEKEWFKISKHLKQTSIWERQIIGFIL